MTETSIRVLERSFDGNVVVESGGSVTRGAPCAYAGSNP